MAAQDDTTKVLIQLAVLGEKIDNLAMSVNAANQRIESSEADIKALIKHEKANADQVHKALDGRIDKKADAAETNRRFESQDKVNWFIGSSSFAAVLSLVGMLIKHLLGA